MMKTLTCKATLRRLHAYHDDELTVRDQIAVSAHLDWCDDCAAALEDLQSLRSALRSARREQSVAAEDDPAFHQSVISRLKAEESMSFASRFQDMFEDMRLVYAGLGASVAALACILMMLNMMRFVKEDQRPDSLAAIVSTLSIPGSQALNQPIAVMPVNVDAQLLMPRSEGATFAADSDSDVDLQGIDAEFAAAGVVTREGRVASLQLVHASSGTPVAAGTEEAKALQKWMGAVARGRYKPARVDGLPVAVNKVWLVAHTTVRPLPGAPLDRPISIAAKKRVTSITDARAPRPA